MLSLQKEYKNNIDQMLALLFSVLTVLSKKSKALVYNFVLSLKRT